MVQIQKLIQCYHVSFTGEHPDQHTTYNRPPGFGNELTRGNLEIMKKLHNEWVDGKAQTTQEIRFINAHFPMGKAKSLFTRSG